jgi:lysophospholipase L1-like esterase
MKIEPGSKFVLIGDSITDIERARPVGEGLFGAEGKGYVALVKGLLDCVYPDQRIRVVNMGTGGNTVLDLKARWQSDVLDLKPDWLSIMIGINDVWRQFDLPLQTETHVLPDQYERTLDEIVAAARPSLKGLVMMTPYYIEPNRADPMRSTMDAYGAIVKKIANRYDAVFVDTQAAFDKVLQHCHANALAWDRVHPNVTGHTVIARALLKSIGFEF